MNSHLILKNITPTCIPPPERQERERERENPLPHFTGIKPLFQAYAESIQEFMLPAGMQEVLQGEKNRVKKS